MLKYILQREEKLYRSENQITLKKKKKDQNPYKIKMLNKLIIEENFFSLVKNIYENPTANIVLNGEKIDTFPLRAGIMQGYYFSPLLFSNIMER